MPNVSIAGQTIEVYADLADANDYFATTLNGGSWADLEALDRIKALVTATNYFERLAWRGQPTQPIDKTQPQPPGTQPIAWPRTGIVDRDGVAVDSATIPLDITRGNMELALLLVGDVSILSQTNSGSNVRRTRSRENVDVIEVESETEYFVPTIRTASKLPTIVHDLVGFYLDSAGPVLTALATGTTVASGAGTDWGTGGSGWP